MIAPKAISLTGGGTVGVTLSAVAKTGFGTRVTPDSAADRAKNDAVSSAIVISALCRTRWSNREVETGKLASNELLRQLMIFAINARRLLEIRGERFSLGRPYWQDAEEHGLIEHEADCWTILNRLVHHREVSLVAWTRSNDSDFCVFSHATVRSDKEGSMKFCPDALARAFLKHALNTDEKAESV